MYNNKGITLTALVVMIIVIMILAGITIIQGSDLIKTTKVETYVTNMITIKSKAKIYAEEINAEVWDAEDKDGKKKEIFNEKYKMATPVNANEITAKVDNNVNTGNGLECYEVSKNTLKEMGLTDLAKEANDGEYAVVYDKSDYKNLDIVYINGIEYNKTKYYTLSSLQKAIDE